MKRVDSKEELKMSGHGVDFRSAQQQAFHDRLQRQQHQRQQRQQLYQEHAAFQPRGVGGYNRSGRNSGIRRTDRVKEGQRMRELWEKQRRKRAQQARRRVQGLGVGGQSFHSGGIGAYGKRFS